MAKAKNTGDLGSEELTLTLPSGKHTTKLLLQALELFFDENVPEKERDIRSEKYVREKSSVRRWSTLLRTPTASRLAQVITRIPEMSSDIQFEFGDKGKITVKMRQDLHEDLLLGNRSESESDSSFKKGNSDRDKMKVNTGNKDKDSVTGKSDKETVSGKSTDIESESDGYVSAMETVPEEKSTETTLDESLDEAIRLKNLELKKDRTKRREDKRKQDFLEKESIKNAPKPVINENFTGDRESFENPNDPDAINADHIDTGGSSNLTQSKLLTTNQEETGKTKGPREKDSEIRPETRKDSEDKCLDTGGTGDMITAIEQENIQSTSKKDTGEDNLPVTIEQKNKNDSEAGIKTTTIILDSDKNESMSIQASHQSGVTSVKLRHELLNKCKVLVCDFRDTIYDNQEKFHEKKREILISYLMQKTSSEMLDTKYDFIVDDNTARNAMKEAEAYENRDLVKALQINNWKIDRKHFEAYYNQMSPDIDLFQIDPLLAMMCDDLPQKIVIHTNMARKAVEDISIKLGINEYIDMIISPDDIDNIFKPNVEAFETVVDRVTTKYHITPEQICYVDCRVTNLRLATAVGCKTVLIRALSIKNIPQYVMDKCDGVLNTFLDMDDIFGKKTPAHSTISETADATIAKIQIDTQSAIDIFSAAKKNFDTEAEKITIREESDDITTDNESQGTSLTPESKIKHTTKPSQHVQEMESVMMELREEEKQIRAQLVTARSMTNFENETIKAEMQQYLLVGDRKIIENMTTQLSIQIEIDKAQNPEREGGLSITDQSSPELSSVECAQRQEKFILDDSSNDTPPLNQFSQYTVLGQVTTDDVKALIQEYVDNENLVKAPVIDSIVKGTM